MFRDRDAMPVRHMGEGSETARLPLLGPLWADRRERQDRQLIQRSDGYGYSQLSKHQQEAELRSACYPSPV